MLALALQLVLIGLYPQVTTCYPSCILSGLVAYCSLQHHYWVPPLPPNITHLYLDLNYISEINSTSLRAYVELQQLDLGMQRVQLVIRNNAFLRQRKLTRLVLGQNIGLQLEPRSFAGLFNLQKLSMDYCNLKDSILTESYLQPLFSLEILNLYGNKIERLQPGLFFSKLTKFTELNLKLNPIKRLCEEDLVGFRGKYFTFLNLESNHIGRMYEDDFDRESCGNPFRGMAFNILDLSKNGLNVITARLFFNAIQGTPIAHLIFSGFIGQGFSFNNLPDPNKNTFEGLMNSTVKIFDLSNNFISTLHWAVFSPLNVVKMIDISKNKIKQIDRNAFTGLQGHLKILNLSSNLLGEIVSHTFTSLTELRVLDLSLNHIGVLDYQAFSGLPKLQALYLTGNSLRDLGSPASLPSLEYLFLSDNKLNSLYKISDLGRNSIYVDVMNNRLTNLEDFYVIMTYFKRLQNFFYSGNFVKWCTLNGNITVPHNNSLKVLDLKDSSLQMIWERRTCLDLFDNLDNLIALDMSLNSLRTFPEGIFRGLSSVIEIDLSSNFLIHLQPGVFPVSLLRLNLSNNLLASPDPMTFQSLIFLSLEANRFYCDCNLESFLKWLNETNVTLLGSAEGYRCEFPAAFHALPLLTYTTIIEPCEEDDEKAVQGLKFALFVFSDLLLVSVIFSGIGYARLRGHIFIIYKKIIGRVLEDPRQTTPLEEAQYDVFICFSDNDYQWVEAALLKKLDNQFSEENIFHCCFEARDFLPVVDHLSNIRDAIWCSRKTVCIISQEFLKDGWCLEALTLAQGRMLEELTNVLIMLVVGKVTPYQLMKYNTIRAFTQKRDYLIWPEDPQDLEWFYERLNSLLLKDTKVKKLAQDKPQSAKSNNQLQHEENIQLEYMKTTVM